MPIPSISDIRNGKVDPKLIEEWTEAYSYCSILHILTELENSNSVSNKTKYLYGLNPILLSDINHLKHDIEKAKFNNELQESNQIAQHKSQTSNIIREIESKSYDSFIEPTSVSDFYQAQGIHISSEIPDKDSLADLQHDASDTSNSDDEQSLLVQMSFRDWLITISETKRKEQEEAKEQEALRLKWKQQKLADAIQEENDEIPEQVFKMAVDSIEKEESLASESLAEVYRLQGKLEKSISMYRKLILINPEKKVYFANKIDELNKQI